MSFDAQLKYSARLQKKRKINAKQLPMQAEVDISISSEMEQWLSSAMESSEEGYLSDQVGNPLSKPLDAMSLYTPLGAIAASQHAAVKPMESINEREDREFRERKSRRLGNNTTTNTFNNTDSIDMGHSYPAVPPVTVSDDEGDDRVMELSRAGRVETSSLNTGFNTTTPSVDESISSHSTTWSTQSAVENRPKPMLVNDAMKRLEVLWLKRRAKIEMDEGDHTKAMETLNDALGVHLGDTGDYTTSDLGSHSHKRPEGLLNYIADTYFDFDKTAHIDAGRIQRCFLKWLRRRSNKVLNLQRFYRGYRVRLGAFRETTMRKHTAQIIQRAFRRYLGNLCFQATRIKRWYITIKLKEEFREKLYYHRNAYRIQRLYRGYGSRMIAAMKRKELDSTSLIQRQGRAWRIRQQRTQALVLIHKRFHENARIIQCAMRRVISIKRSQIQILTEMVREEERQERETGVVDEAIAIQLKKVGLYMKTDTGKLHMKFTKNRIRTKDKAYKKTKSALTDEEVMAHDAMVSFELFDTDGSGLIDEIELAQMLKQLAIPMDPEGVKALAGEIDADGSGDIDFGEFMDWYTRGGSQNAEAEQSLEDKMFKQILKARTMIMEITGVILQKRTERDMLRQATTWQSKDIAATFRNTHAPKFQCCQCMEPFVFFADYQEHFDKKGRCAATKQRAVFFEKFWIHQDWNYQRQIEKEIRRLNDELPNINYQSLVATFHDISLQENIGVRGLTVNYVRKAQIMYMNKFAEAEENAGSGKSMAEEIMAVVKICGDDHLNPLVAMTVAECIGAKIPMEWIAEDEWEMDVFSDWVEEIVDKDIALRSPPSYKKCFNQEKEKLKQDTWLLGTIYVRIVRLLQVAAESSLIAIMECRSRRPREMTIPDSVLIAKGFDHLTKANYEKAKRNIVDKLQIANDAFEKLCTIYAPTSCESLLKRTTGKIPVGPDGKLSEEDLRKILINDVHIRAMASFKGRTNSSVGRTQVRRLASELWATRYYHQKNGQAIGKKQGKVCGTASSARKAGNTLYLYERYASAATGDGIDMWDMDLVQRAMSIYISEAQWPEVRTALDPKRTGYIAFDLLFKWIMENQHRKYISWTQGAYNATEYVIWQIIDSIYLLHAEQNLLSNIRKISRLELDYRRKSIEALILQANLPEDEVNEEKPLTSSEELAKKKAEEDSDDDDDDDDNDDDEEEKAKKTAANNRPDAEVEKDKQRIAELQLETLHLNEKIVKIKNADDEGESLLLFRLAEQEAENKCVREFYSRQGIYNILTEMLIMKSANQIIEAYGFCISPFSRYPWTSRIFGAKVPKIKKADQQLRHEIKQKNSKSTNSSADADDANDDEEVDIFDPTYETGWALALAVLVYAYDTDCSGTFDEGEVRLLLSNALCGMNEREILFKFPEVKDDSATLHTMVNYLAPKVFWGRGLLARLGFAGSTFILTKPSIKAATSMLVSLNRQFARAKAEEAAELARTGHLKEEEEAKNDDALMMRAQMLAMRQVILYLRTIQGRFKYRATKKQVKYWWSQDCWKSGFSREGLMKYAISIHSDYKGVLITELPHLLRYCVIFMRFYTTSYVSEIAKMMEEVRTRDDVYWLSLEDTLSLLDKALSPTSSYFSAIRQKPQVLFRRFYCMDRDTKCNMYAKARQQAVLIALQFEGIFVADTNYRCSVLGLHDVMHDISKQANWGILRKKVKDPENPLDWKNVPREATMFLLLSRGYEMEDLVKGDVPQWAEVEHTDGGIAADVVNVRDCLEQVNVEVKKTFRSGGFIGTFTGYAQAAKRWVNFATQRTGGLVHYWNYFRVGKAIMTEGKEVNKQGAKYLRELITGQSHCVVENEE